MPASRTLRILSVLSLALLVLSAGCASLAARRHYGVAQKAESRGDLDEAINAYRSALEADPSNSDYQQALRQVVRARAREHAVDPRGRQSQPQPAPRAPAAPAEAEGVPWGLVVAVLIALGVVAWVLSR